MGHNTKISFFNFLKDKENKSFPLVMKILLQRDQIGVEDLFHSGLLNLEEYSNYDGWLPDNLTINGHLFLESTNIETLPKNLRVNGSLWLRYSRIKELPHDLIVYQKIIFDFTPLAAKEYNYEYLKEHSPFVNRFSCNYLER
jgi:hypothetical protein